ncbi:CBS domain-containing protein [Halorutilales archaeon Cl-col2-1]
MDIAEMASTEFDEFDTDARLSKISSAFENDNLKAVVLTDGSDYKGIVTERQLISSHIKPKQKAKTVMTHPSKVERTEDVRETARLMVESNSKVLPVFEGGSLYGIVTADTLLGEVNSHLDVLTVGQIYSQNLVTVTPGTTLGEIINDFRENGISRMPVIEDGSLEGIVTIHDVINFSVREMSKSQGGSPGSFADGRSQESHGGFGSREGGEDRMLDLPAYDVMSSPVATTTPDTDVNEAVDEMLEMGYSSLVVTDDGETDGILTKTDVLRALSLEEETQMQVRIANIDLLDDMTRGDVVNVIENVSDKYSEMQVLEAHVDLHKHKEQLRGSPLILARLRLFTDKGQFAGTGEGYGAEHAIHLARNKLERNVLDTKELQSDQQQAEMLLRRFGTEI